MPSLSPIFERLVDAASLLRGYAVSTWADRRAGFDWGASGDVIVPIIAGIEALAGGAALVTVQADSSSWLAPSNLAEVAVQLEQRVAHAAPSSPGQRLALTLARALRCATDTTADAHDLSDLDPFSPSWLLPALLGLEDQEPDDASAALDAQVTERISERLRPFYVACEALYACEERPRPRTPCSMVHSTLKALLDRTFADSRSHLLEMRGALGDYGRVHPAYHVLIRAVDSALADLIQGHDATTATRFEREEAT